MNCERYQDWMTSAAVSELRASRRSELESHLGECAGCRAEFQRVRTVLQAIDLGVTAQAAAEPSPRLVEHVRERIRDEAPVGLWRNRRWAPAAGCAAVLVLASVWILWLRNVTPRESAPNPTTPSSAQANRSAVVANAATRRTTPERHTRLATLVRPARKLNARRIERSESPEIIVQPGQMKAVMLFVQVMNSQKIDGAKLLADLKTADQPLGVQALEIKPLVIAPLETPTLAEDKSGESASDGGKKKFIDSGKSR